jgi:hypothetical protein
MGLGSAEYLGEFYRLVDHYPPRDLRMKPKLIDPDPQHCMLDRVQLMDRPVEDTDERLFQDTDMGRDLAGQALKIVHIDLNEITLGYEFTEDLIRIFP